MTVRAKEIGRDEVRKSRIALADQYGGSMPSGWTRWLLEQFEFPFEVVYPKALDLGNLSAKYDVIILPSGVGPAPANGGRGGRGGGGGGGGGRGGGGGSIPAEFEPMVGAYTAALMEIRLGAPFLLNLLGGGLVTACVGVLVGLPSLRVKGLYLAIATIAASFILPFVFVTDPDGIKVELLIKT